MKRNRMDVVGKKQCLWHYNRLFFKENFYFGLDLPARCGGVADTCWNSSHLFLLKHGMSRIYLYEKRAWNKCLSHIRRKHRHKNLHHISYFRVCYKNWFFASVWVTYLGLKTAWKDVAKIKVVRNSHIFLERHTRSQLYNSCNLKCRNDHRIMS